MALPWEDEPTLTVESVMRRELVAQGENLATVKFRRIWNSALGTVERVWLFEERKGEGPPIVVKVDGFEDEIVRGREEVMKALEIKRRPVPEPEPEPVIEPEPEPVPEPEPIA